MPTQQFSDREVELATASGLPVEEVVAKLAAGLLFYQEYNFGRPTTEGEWLDATGTEYVVCAHGYWGKGETVQAAKDRYRREGGRLNQGYIILTFGPGSVFLGIGPMGWQYLGQPPTQTEVQPKGKR